MLRTPRASMKGGKIMSEEIKPFKIHVSDAELDDQKRRLRATRLPDKETVGEWSQGVPLAYVKDVCRYWAETYHWHDTEARLNALPQFRTELEWAEHSLLAHSIAASGRAAAGDDAWLAGFDRRVPQGDSDAHRSDQAWRTGERCFPHCVSQLARVRVFRQAFAERMGC
jgi:hypothetical protein